MTLSADPTTAQPAGGQPTPPPAGPHHGPAAARPGPTAEPAPRGEAAARGPAAGGRLPAAWRPDGVGLLRALVWAALAAVVLFPLAVVVELGLRPDGFATLRADDAFATAARNSVVSALASAALATAAGTALAVVLDRWRVPGGGALRWIYLSPFLIPPFIGAIAWTALLGPAGPVNQAWGAITGGEGQLVEIYGGGGVIALLALHSYPLAYLVIAAGLRGIPADVEEAARISGAPPWRTWWDVTMPLLRPSILAAFILTAVANLSDFGIPALVGLPDQYVTLTTLVYRYLASRSVADPLAAVSAIGVVLLLVALAAVLLQRRRRGPQLEGKGRTWRAELGAGRWAVAALAWGGAIVVAVLPLLSLAVQATLVAPGVPLRAENLTLDHLRTALGAPNTLDGVLTSVLLAGGAAVICGVLGLAIGTLLTRSPARTNAALDLLALLPQALPGLVIAVGWLLVGAATGLFNTRWIILGAYVMAFLAIVVQAVRGPLTATPTALEEAARVSGASRLRAMADITWRLAAPAAATGALLVALTAGRELTISILLVAPGTATLGVTIFNLQQAGSYGTAAALSLVVALVGMAGLGFAARALARP